MTAAAKLLDRLTRVKATRQGQWMAACPCCESKEGRPLAVKESDDGRVLLFAFCGCTTAQVLQRLGLTINDLFEKPVTYHAAPSRQRVAPADVLNALADEVAVVSIALADIDSGKPIDKARLTTALRRIGNARTYINERVK
jgi:hypothetical protein